MDTLIEIRNITAGYGKKTVLRDVSVDVFDRDFLGIIGPNGGGKTTLLKIILGLIKPFSGSITFYQEGKPVPAIRMGYLPQINNIDRKFPISVRETVASGLVGQKRMFRSFTDEQWQRTDEVIRQMNLEPYARNPIGELSGGQLQRVLLGRAVVSRPQLLILDEPNSYVDKQFESNFYESLTEINHESAIILVSHDIGTILPLVQNVACVNETIHYHPGRDISAEWLGEHYICPIELIGHGDLPHRVLKKHDH